MKVVFHLDAEEVSDKLDHTTIRVPPNKPTKIESDFYAEKFMEHKQAHHGLVYVEQIDDGDGGFKLDMPRARVEAAAALDQCEKNCIQEYIDTQREDRLRLNFPALPPRGRAERVIRKRAIDLLGLGIRPVGWEVEKQEAEKALERESVGNLKKQNALLTETLAKLSARLEQLEKVVA